jgi:hypothetical protein
MPDLRPWLIAIGIIATLGAIVMVTRTGALLATQPTSAGFVVEQVGNPVLPFQAVRLRRVIVNNGTRRIGPMLSTDFGFLWTGIRGPGESKFQRPRSWKAPDLEHDQQFSYRAHWDQEAAIYLEPGQQLASSFATAAHWRDERNIPFEGGIGIPLFPTPGEYVFRFEYGPEVMGKRPHAKELRIAVGAPQGDDKALYELLQRDRILASMLMSPVDVPNEKLVAQLTELVSRYPKSSYADYARFALARGYRSSIGVQPKSTRVAHAWTADALADIGGRFDLDTKRDIFVHFAYQPSALILRVRVDPVARRDTLAHLHKYFPDAFEWVEEFGRMIIEQNEEDVEFLTGKKFAECDWKREWEAFRKKAPAPPAAPSRKIGGGKK